MKREIFLIDTNAFISPYRTYYPFDLAPSFWGFLEQSMATGDIVLLDVVYDEVTKGDDDLSQWLSGVEPQCLKRAQADILAVYKQILNDIQQAKTHTGQPLYNAKALNEWAQYDIADPWLVATAKARDYTLVSFESPSGALGASTLGRVKIPDEAKKFGVKCCNLFEMMRALQFQFK